MKLGEGRYILFERVGDTKTTGAGPVSFTSTRFDEPEISPELVTIRSKSGGVVVPVTPFSSSGSETLNRGDSIYEATLEFHVPRPGQYEVRVDGPKSARFVITRGLEDTFARVLDWIALGGLAALMMFSGIAVVVVGQVRKGRRAATDPPIGPANPAAA
jgi:hypothetical protein